MITNPPYGERIGEKEIVSKLNKHFGEVKEKLDTWDFNILTACPDFQKSLVEKLLKTESFTMVDFYATTINI